MRIENILVSIIIPTYKRSKDLTRAIDTALDQTHRNIEVIVVDDNPPDSEDRIITREKLQAYKDEPRLVYHENAQNVGGAQSRNEGIKIAKGAYITFLDDDDEYLPEKVERQLAYMVENNLELSFTDSMLYNNQGQLIDVRKHSYVTSLDNDDLLIQHILHRLTGTPTLMYEANAIKRIGGFDQVLMGHEYQLMLKSIERGLRIGYLPECHVRLYVHKIGGISRSSVKVSGEHDLFEQSKTYFDRLTPAQRRYVRFRYHTVLMITAKRGGAPLQACIHFFKAVLASPAAALYEVFNHFKKLHQAKKEVSSPEKGA